MLLDPLTVQPPDDTDCAAWLSSTGEIFAVIRGHDSGCTSYGLVNERGRWFVKVAFGDDVGQLESTVAFHSVVKHATIVPLVATFPVRQGECPGRAVVYPWVDGEILNDPFAPGSLPHAEPASALSRFRALCVVRVLTALDAIYTAHEEVARRGHVAVDFYDGCVMYDFETAQVRLVDLDMYRPGPYVLDRDRQFGSRRFMAPEEFARGAVIDERTTVFTLGRAARVFLGEPGAWRAGQALDRVIGQATREDPADRFQSVVAFTSAWHEARTIR